MNSAISNKLQINANNGSTKTCDTVDFQRHQPVFQFVPKVIFDFSSDNGHMFSYILLVDATAAAQPFKHFVNDHPKSRIIH